MTYSPGRPLTEDELARLRGAAKMPWWYKPVFAIAFGIVCLRLLVKDVKNLLWKKRP